MRLGIDFFFRHRQLGLAGQLLELFLDPDNILVGLVGEFDGLEDDILGDFFGPRLHHDDFIFSADHNKVELAFIILGHLGIQDQLAVDIADIHGADRASNGISDSASTAEEPMTESISGSFSWSAESTVVTIWISLCQLLGKQRAYGAVRHAAGEDSRLAGAPLPADKAPGYFTGGIKPLFVVDGQGQKIHPFPGFFVKTYGNQDYGIAVADGYRGVSLLGEFARFNN